MRDAQAKAVWPCKAGTTVGATFSRRGMCKLATPAIGIEQGLHGVPAFPWKSLRGL